MSEDEINSTDTTAEETEQHQADELSERERTRLIDANVAAPVNAAAALDIVTMRRSERLEDDAPSRGDRPSHPGEPEGAEGVDPQDL